MIRSPRLPSPIPWFLLALGCSTEGRDGGTTDDGVVLDGVAGEETTDETSGTADAASEAGAETDTDTEDESEGGSHTKFDLAPWPDGTENPIPCTAPTHKPCDHGTGDPWNALGLNCPGGEPLTAKFTGDPQALHVHVAPLGTANPPTYPALEGEKFVILSSGVAQQLATPGIYASTKLPDNDPMTLPAPLKTNEVAGDCVMDPNLIGTGDCSNTIHAQWEQGKSAYDYAELRITGKVPASASGFAYHLAFFSTEYPVYYQSSFNDMYIAWLESELWTGNVSFDEMGHPISLNAGFLDYKDAPNPVDCPAPCTAPELQGTAMEGHAGTKWLQTTAGVAPGEDFTLIFAIFDLSDGILDSAVILDDFEWNCEGGAPVTIPG